MSSHDGKTLPEIIAQDLRVETPKVKNAIKSYISLCSARFLAASESDLTFNRSLISSPSRNYNHYSKSDPNHSCQSLKGIKDQVDDIPEGQSIISNNRTDSTNHRMRMMAPEMEFSQAFQCARALLKFIDSISIPEMNSTTDNMSRQINHTSESNAGPTKFRTFSANTDEEMERKVTRIVWNGLISAHHKPSLLMGRTALRYAWPNLPDCLPTGTRFKNQSDSVPIIYPDIPNGVDDQLACRFYDVFWYLLHDYDTNGEMDDDNDKQLCNFDQDRDAPLIWDCDGGKKELERRRKRRERAAMDRKNGKN